MSDMAEGRNLSTELWREYDFGGRVYRIEAPLEMAREHEEQCKLTLSDVGI